MAIPITPNQRPRSAGGGFFAGYERFPGILDHPPRILDTTQVLNELKTLVRYRMPINGVITPESLRRAPLLASRHVYDEIYRADGYGHADKFGKLAEQSRAEGWPTDPAVFRDAFESRMLPLIRFVETGDLFDGHEVVLSVGNPSDVPTARLTLLLALGRPIVLSKDSHLNRTGLASVKPDVVLQGFAAMETTELSVYATGYVSVSAAKRVNRAVNQFSDTIGVKPVFIWCGVVLAAGLVLYWVMQKPERKAVAAKLIQPVAGLYVTVVREGYQAAQTLSTQSIPEPDHPTLAQRIAGLLLDTRHRHGVASLRHALTVDDSSAGPTEEEIEATLRALPCFTPSEGGGWQLGEVLSPPAA
jgi:hypothetical protein